NAAGVWADDVRALDEGVHPGSIRPAKGVHLTLPWAAVRNDIAVILPVPRDRRSVFVVPWGEQTYVGTTDTDYDGRLDDPQCTPDDVSYLLGALNAAMSEPVSEADVVGTWAGLRPLLRGAGDARTADLSRRHAVRVAPSGVVTVTGGKLTTYRRMAADAGPAARPRRHGRGRRRHRVAARPRARLVGGRLRAQCGGLPGERRGRTRAHTSAERAVSPLHGTRAPLAGAVAARLHDACAD